MQSKKFTNRWPAYLAAWLVGAFVIYVTGAWLVSHVMQGRPIDTTAWIIAGATALRGISVGMALSSVQAWGLRLPKGLVLTGLWGAAAAQLIYPLAETVVKLLILLHILDLPSKGISNMTATGWFNFGAAWLVFGLPGVLFALAARSFQNRFGLSWKWPLIGLGSGIVFLFLLGVIITSLS